MSFPSEVITARSKKTKKVSISFIFNESMRYDSNGDVAGMKWSKLGGTAYNLLNAQKNSAMIGFRYNETSKLYESTLYWHDKAGNAYYGPKDPYSIVDFTDGDEMIAEFEYNDVIDETVVTLYKNGKWVFCYGVPLRPGWYMRIINSWFGGTDPAYRDSWFKKLITIVKY